MSFIYVKKKLSEWEMKNKADKKNAEHKKNIEVSYLKQGSEMNGFCLKQGQGLKASAAHPHPNFP